MTASMLARDDQAPGKPAAFPRTTQTSPSETSAQDCPTYLVFEVSGQPFALPTSAVRFIHFLGELSRPPTAFPALAGFLNDGGVALPVLRLSKLLKLPDQPVALYTPIILFKNIEPACAILVDKVQRVAAVRDEDLFSLPQQHLADRALAIDGRVVGILAPRCLLLEEERQRLVELQADEERRIRELGEVPM